jgi:23S rRNA pseudouridine1911/1915/1917 synthase
VAAASSTEPVEHVVAATEAGTTLAALVRQLCGGAPWSRARALCERGKVTLDGQVETDGARRLHAGARVRIDEAARRPRPGTIDHHAIVHLDAHVVVVNKPAGLMSVRYEETDRDTLIDQVQAWLRRNPERAGRAQGSRLGAVQRLDKDTTGLLVFARSVPARRALQSLFRAHDIERRYVAIAHGQVAAGRHETFILPDRGDGLRGSFGRFRRAQGEPPAEAQRAVTHVRPLEALRGATRVECRLETGKQHQIRIHLAEAGHPLVGEAVYVRDYRGPRIEAPRVMLHAAVLGFRHPGSGELVRFEQAPPDDFAATLERLRG